MCQHTDPGMTLKHRDLIHSGWVATAGGLLLEDREIVLCAYVKGVYRGVCDGERDALRFSLL